MAAFPVEERIDAIRRHLAANRDVVLTAPPGSGKTTCVPPALLDAPWLVGKKIVMLEPRRIAARSCATFIAHKLGESVGGTVGYQVRLERKISAATRLEIVTEGLLTQRLLADPELADVGLVIFDEFHERSLACDLSFALALEVRRALRPDLRLLVMSATLDAESVAAHLGDAEIVRAEGRMYPVETKYLGEMSMTGAIQRALRETDGDILCFLPGEGEIRRTESALRETGAKTNAVVLPLYGSLSKDEQDKVFQPLPPPPSPLIPHPSSHPPPRKVILATSIAETSVTIPGISCVIDSGLMRVPRFSPSTGMSGLVTLPLTQDRAEQRRGRAGRVRAGTCYRLWTEGEQQSRPRKAQPEILDADLCSLVLTSAAWGALKREDLPWMTPPPAATWEQAVGLLKLLGALSSDGRLTPKGERMAKLPMHPRLANMMMEGWNGLDVWKFGGLDVVAVAKPREGRSPSRPRPRQSAALPNGNGGFATASVWKFGGLEVRECARFGERLSMLAAIIEEGSRRRETDIRRILDEILETPNRPDSRRIIQFSKRFLHPNLQTSKPPNSQTPKPPNPQTPKPPTLSEGASLALAYPDRVAKNRGNGTFQMVNGRGAFLPDDDLLAKEPYLVACELDDRPGDAKIFLGCPIDEREILDLFGDRIVEEPYCAWDRRTDRVKCVTRRKLGAMTLGERPEATIAGENAGRVAEALLEGIRLKGVENLPCWTKETLQLRARIDFIHRTLPDAAWPSIDGKTLLAALEGFVGGLTKWKDLERVDLAAVMDFILSEAGHDRRELDRLAPTRMEVPSGSHMTIRYAGDEPTVEVRLQECFGLMETPKVAGGRVPIVMTLLSPAQRPIQITKDLAGFWKGAYQLVRKDMRGQYPKHYWPEDPFTAIATRRVRPKS